MMYRWFLIVALLLPAGMALAQDNDDFAIPGDIESEAESFMDGAQIAVDPDPDWIGATPSEPTAMGSGAMAPDMPAAPSKVEIPADWKRYSLLGISFATPPDWQVMSKPDDDDEIFVAYFNEAEKRAAAVGVEYVVPGQIDDFEEDIGELPRDASKDLGIDLGGMAPRITYPPAVTAPDGARLTRKRAELDHPKLYYFAEEYLKENRNDRGGADGLRIMAINIPKAEILPIIELIEASVTLDAAPPPEVLVGLGEMVEYPMPLPTGWKRWADMEDALTFATSPVFSASMTFQTGYRAKQSWQDETEFAMPPETKRGAIFGQTASIKSGLTKEPIVQMGFSIVPALRSVYLLDTCLANGEPILVETYAAERWLETSDYSGLTDAISFTLPADALPCPPRDVASVATPGAPPQAVTPVAPPSPPPAASQAASGWTEYRNARFGTSLRYPRSHFELTGEPPANDDGRTFTSPDGSASMLVWGGYNVLEQSIAELAVEAAEGRDPATLEIYRTGANWFSVKFRNGGTVSHWHAVLDGQDVVHNVLIRYPAVQEANFGPVAEAIVASLAAPSTANTPPPQARPEPDPMESAFWRSIEGSHFPDGFRAYLEHWPNGPHADEARRRLAALDAPSAPAPADNAQMELAFWQSVQGSSDPAMYQAYLDQWPNGTFAALARLQIQRLGGVAVPAPNQVGPGAVAVAPPPPLSESRYYTPARGTVERQSIMDAARVPIQRELEQPVIFLVSQLRTDGTWVFLQAEPLQPDGSRLDWRTTPYARDWAADVMSDVVMVLMQRQGSAWQVVDYVIGPTDVYWYNWLSPYGLSERLFSSER